ncbi:hypothetical protein Tco_0642993 [Tanacetum coccineum]
MPVELGSFDVIIGMDGLKKLSRFCDCVSDEKLRSSLFSTNYHQETEEEKSRKKKIEDVQIVEIFRSVLPRLASALIMALPEGSEDVVAFYCDAVTQGLRKLTARGERTFQTLEDHDYVLGNRFLARWVKHLPLAEFSYYNSYLVALKAAPYEAWIGQRAHADRKRKADGVRSWTQSYAQGSHLERRSLELPQHVALGVWETEWVVRTVRRSN